MSTSSCSSVQLTPNSSPIPYDSTNKTKKADNNDIDDAKPRHQARHSPSQPTPKLRLHLQDLTHPATKSFINLISDPNAAINTALANIVMYLYTSPPERNQSRNTSSSHAPRTHPHFNPSIPATRSVTFIIRDMPGVAYTTGTELDSDHKEIHFSLSYISTVSNTFADAACELLGVITHELVHCYQHTRPQSHPGEEERKKKRKKKKSKKMKQKMDKSGPVIPNPPSGLIEGIADFVRLKAGLVPPHWKRPMSKPERGGRWDQGYQITAFFLEWIEDVKVGEGAVGMLNDRLLRVGYVGESDGNGDGEDDGDNGDDGDDGDDEDGGDDGEGDQERAGVMTDDKDLAKCGFWSGLFGAGVMELWEQYGEYLDALKAKDADATTQRTESTSSWQGLKLHQIPRNKQSIQLKVSEECGRAFDVTMNSIIKRTVDYIGFSVGLGKTAAFNFAYVQLSHGISHKQTVFTSRQFSQAAVQL
ncbi:PBSP domain-containing protein [Blastomyces gilchristii SLH14081]|uniref:PBSP domain-containing protein n=1 Tax=Blastomyces gilchristii (strain SLH14081) TaxID=559298 RepID=A0A179UCR7_BLAGS|nr:PBSP domain-containing protein [Blastomyces gilchristii SLH14081]OAT04312.1 PBSP domain-containing protein [Blastomyces gilchristii SLH14081]